jgi:hypothetical protein
MGPVGVPLKGALLELTPTPSTPDFKCFAVAAAVVVVVECCCEVESTFLAGSPLITLLSGTGRGKGGVKSTLFASRDIVADHNFSFHTFLNECQQKLRIFKINFNGRNVKTNLFL